MSGPAAQEAFCRAPDELLSQKIAYRMMTPVFGEGVVFDAPPERLNEQLRILMPALRDRNMRTYADIFTAEVDGMVAGWGGQGEIDLLDFTAELTTYTSSHCLLGSEFRRSMNEEFARVYGDLEKGVNAIAYVNPYLPLPVFRRRDRARARLLEMITAIIDQRRASGATAQDALQVLMESRYSDGTALTPNEITGILTASMFAGHHTSSGTEAWTLIELARHPEWMARVVAELDGLYARDGGLTYQAFREVPVLESVLKEVLRLHPPLVILMRGVLADFVVEGVTIPAGKLVAISPAVSHRIPELFRDPDPLRPEPLRPGPRGGRDAVRVDSLRGRTPSLLGRGVRDHAAEGDHHEPAAALHVRARGPAGLVWAGLHEDGGAGPPAVPGALSAAGRRRSRGRNAHGRRQPPRPRTARCACGSTSGSARGMRCASRRRRPSFGLNAQQTAVEVLQAEAPAALRDQIATAVKHCPTHALTIEDA